jgi:RNA polymerase sigma factor (sigma-70 family)
MGEHANLDWPADFVPLLGEIQRVVEVMCSRRSVRERKADIVQAVLLELVKGRDRYDFKYRGQLFNFIRTTVQRMITRERKLAAREGHEEFVEPSMLAGIAHGAPEDPRIAIADMLSVLADDTQREIFRLRAVEGLKQREIAARLGVSDATVSRHLERISLILSVKYGGEPGGPGADA